MKNKPILIVAGEPKSIFFEIFFKSIKKNKFQSPLILIASKEIVFSQMKRFKYSKKINLIDKENLNKFSLNNKSLNLIDVSCKDFNNSKFYIKNCFNISFKIIKSGFTDKFINGPIDKSKFLDKKFYGITEYIAKKFNSKKVAMLIYNKELSVCPITTHVPLKLVNKSITKKTIEEKVTLINDFYKKNFGFTPKLAITGLNPHCESILKFNEDQKIIKPTVKSLIKKGFKIKGPFAADTIFLKQNRLNYDVIIGMYHDQVLTPIKTINEYNAVNITLGLPFYRLSPDHGPNKKMLNKNLSNPLSLIQSIKFLDKR